MTARAAFASYVGQKDREQTVWTPPWFLDAVDQVFPEGWFDPYPSVGSPATTRAKVSVGGFKYDSLTHPWADRNFANPPYDKLKDHMPRMCEQFEREDRQTIGLVPVRTRREWWCASATGHAVAYLKPVTFVDAKTGEPIKGSMPENMAAVYWGDRFELFERAFAPLSHHVQERF